VAVIEILIIAIIAVSLPESENNKDYYDVISDETYIECANLLIDNQIASLKNMFDELRQKGSLSATIIDPITIDPKIIERDTLL
jgi:hypothetical protein